MQLCATTLVIPVWRLYPRYEILRSCLCELARAGIITDPHFSLGTFREAAQLAAAASNAVPGAWPVAGGGAADTAVLQPNAGQGGACSMEDAAQGGEAEAAAAAQQQHTNHLSR